MTTEINLTAEVDGATGAVLWTALASTYGATTHEASAVTVEGALFCLVGNLYAEMVGVRQAEAGDRLMDARESAMEQLDPEALAALERSRARIRQREAEQNQAALDG